LAFLTFLSALWASPRFVAGIVCGGLICIINFHWLYRNLRTVFAQLTEKAKSAVMIRYYLRFVLTAAVLFVVITREWVDIFGLVIGLSIVVVNIVLTVVLVFGKKNLIQEVR
jgi:hypothetical protein